MNEIYALPQPLTGQELVTIHQIQNGNMVSCSMTLASLDAWINSGMNAWADTLPTTIPSSAGVVWNNGGMVSIS